MSKRLYIGTAAWSIPKDAKPSFPAEGSHLERYAQVFDGVEINTSFYRPHQPKTYARWAGCVPERFRFAVKVPRTITHERRLVEADEPLARFLDECGALGRKLGPLLVQLPPSLALDERDAERFLVALRRRHGGAVVLEPRHASWFTLAGETLLLRYDVARVAADPPPVPAAATPGGSDRVVYVRLHGTPRIYWSPYPPETIARVTADLQVHAARGAETWCIYDNTAAGHATLDALAALRLLREDAESPVTRLDARTSR